MNSIMAIHFPEEVGQAVAANAVHMTFKKQIRHI